MKKAPNNLIYKNLLPSLNYRTYPLRSTRTGFIVNIGDYDSHFPYRETEFYQFDQFLFANWERKEGKKGKDRMPWGGMLSE